MESQQIIWLVIYIVLLLLVYIGYGAGIAANDFPNKDDRTGAIWTLFTLSLLTFIITMAVHVFTNKNTIAAIFLMISIFFDTILSVIIGTTNMEGDYSAALGYISISPIVYKLLLFLFVNWDACGDGAVSAKLGEGGDKMRQRWADARAARLARLKNE